MHPDKLNDLDRPRTIEVFLFPMDGAVKNSRSSRFLILEELLELKKQLV
jgi:hypothetical protein